MSPNYRYSYLSANLNCLSVNVHLPFEQLDRQTSHIIDLHTLVRLRLAVTIFKVYVPDQTDLIVRACVGCVWRYLAG